MSDPEFVDVSWRLTEEGGGEAVAHVLGENREPEERAYEFDSLEDEELPPRLTEIIREDGRRFGVWTRD